MHKNSQTIMPREKSEIRIIHIFAPQIIKTDAANFRELVQRLTGKPKDNEGSTKKSKTKFNEQESRNTATTTITTTDNNNNNNNFRANKVKGFHAEGFGEKMNGEEEIWRDANTGGGFLGGFSEFDIDHGMILQDQINHYDPFAFMISTNRQTDGLEESRVA
ncbi:hypothetical protein OROHE_011636 [Orobanche hederae]